MKIAYKGFDENLKCKNFQFEIGGSYFNNIDRDEPRTCTSDGWHYCNELVKVFSYYANNGKNRFCEIEITGKYKDDKDGKSITNSFKIIRELSKEEVADVIKIDEYKKLSEKLGIPLVRQIQDKYPHIILGGSVALFLYGVELRRFKDGYDFDIDLITPYFTLIETDSIIKVRERDDQTSGNDFDDAFYINGKKVDLKIEPKQRYNIVEVNGFKYKLCSLETIIEAKSRYALKGNKKHKGDLYEICKVNITANDKKKDIDELPY